MYRSQAARVTSKDTLSVIEGSGKGPKPWRRRSLSESEQITCWRCEEVTGTATSATVVVTLAPRRRPNGKATSGTRIVACAHCLARGEVTKLAIA
jgi:hypothetical protein